MFSRSGYNDNLKELVKANKADKSIAVIVKENLSIQADAKNSIKKTEKEIERLSITGENKMNIKMQTPFYNIKDYLSILMEIRGIKKQLKQKSHEVEALNKEAKKAELENTRIEEEIDNQFKIYQENEIYTRAINKINTAEMELSEKSIKAYQKHVDKYNNSIFSLEKNSRLPEPNTEDFVTILNMLVEVDKANKESNSEMAQTKTRKSAAKKTTSKEENTESKAKKTTAKKTTSKEGNTESKAKKTTAKKTTSKEENTESKAKKTTAKKTTSKEENTESKAKKTTNK